MLTCAGHRMLLMLKFSLCLRSDLKNSWKTYRCKDVVHGLEWAEIPGTEEIAQYYRMFTLLCCFSLYRLHSLSASIGNTGPLVLYSEGVKILKQH